jgi:hypothetical protein
MPRNEPARDLVRRPPSSRALTAGEFRELAQVPPATEWFANIDNANTRRAYRNDLKEFMSFVGIAAPDELRLITRAHILAWRKDLEHRKLAGSTVRRKLARPSPRSLSTCATRTQCRRTRSRASSGRRSKATRARRRRGRMSVTRVMRLERVCATLSVQAYPRSRIHATFRMTVRTKVSSDLIHM